MKTTIGRILIGITLCMGIFGCRDSLSSVLEDKPSSADGKVPVQLVVGGVAANRTIAPDHIERQDLEDPSRYKIILDATSNIGDSFTLDPVSFSHGMVGLDLKPGIWTLRLTATDMTSQKQILSGSSVVLVQSKPITATVTLAPLQGQTGTVDITFSLSDSIMKRLDTDTAGDATITVALYDTLKQEVPGTKTVFTQAPTGAAVTVRYTANSSTPLNAGRYSIRLESHYTVQNGSTQNQPFRYEMGFQDILYIEGNRVTRDTIELSSNSKEMGIPGNPARIDKLRGNGSSKTNNFTRATRFTPWGETLWMYGAYWDGEGNGTVNGNEVLVINWGSVYNADFYEVEVLFHPFPRVIGGGGGSDPNPYGKIEAVVFTDADWDALRRKTFTYNNVTKTPSYLRFSGSSSDPNYYKNHYSTINYVLSNGSSADFLTCADKTLAKRIFSDSVITAGKGNARYRVSGNDIWDTYGVYVYNRQSVGKIGLERGCSVLGIITPSFAPRMSVVFRVRAVNQYGHSDWVYWKGGMW